MRAFTAFNSVEDVDEFMRVTVATYGDLPVLSEAAELIVANAKLRRHAHWRKFVQQLHPDVLCSEAVMRARSSAELLEAADVRGTGDSDKAAETFVSAFQ